VFDITFFAGTPVHSKVISLRPASRDKSDDARSGNTNPVRPVRGNLAITNNRQTIEQAPYLLQSLLNLRPARPSKVSSGLGSDVPNGFDTIQNTWKLPDLSSLHNVGRTRISSQADAKLVFLQKTKTITELTVPHPTGAEHHADRSAARPERSDPKGRDSVRTK